MEILIVEDDTDIAELVAYNLERQGWHASLCHHGNEGLELIRRTHPDLVILDIMLPGMDGLEIFRRMKEDESTREIPALFLTARAQLDDRLTGLKLGADDYITKPFSPKELVLRVRNILQRVNRSAARLIVHSGPLCLNKNTMVATLRGKNLNLTPIEFKLLAYLAERPGKVQDRYELQHILLGYADASLSRTLDTHVKRLRQKLGDHAACIVTERGIGYSFKPFPTPEEG